jgi:hypothetical protein
MNIGNPVEAALAAGKVTATAPDGVVLVTVAKAAAPAAGYSTASAGAAGAAAGFIMLCVNQFITLTTEQNASAVVLLTAGLTYLFAWLRHKHELAVTPGA